MDEKPTATSLGKIAEDYIASKLRKNNQNVINVDFTNEKVISHRNRTIIDRVQNTMIWEEIDTKKIKEIIKVIKENILGFPDLVCIDKETKEVSFVEVKANTSQLNKQQKETITKLRKAGFLVNVRFVKVKCDVSEVGK